MMSKSFSCSLGRFFSGCVLALLSLSAFSASQLEVQKISPGVYALVGDLTQRTPENLGNNSTHGVIITEAGVILIDPGGSYLGAKRIDEAIESLTDQPVKLVIDTGGQDHRWLGNGYFKDHGAQIISSAAAVDDQHERADYHLNRLGALIGEALEGTQPVYADEVFESEKRISLGGTKLEIHHVGAAHTVGDSFVWLPEQKIMFTGDIVFTERALGIGPAKNIKSWLTVFKTMAAYQPEIVVPGHGHSTNLATATHDTYDYLNFLFENISKMLDEGVDLQDAIDLDQSEFSYLKNFELISRKNAQSVYEQLEFDSF